MIWYKKFDDSSIIDTPDEEIARERGYILTTDEEIITVSDSINGDKRYLKSEFEELEKTKEYQEKLTKEREKAFRAEFIELSIGCFRKQPQGYANAVEAFSRIDIKVAAFGGLTEQLAQIVTFYKKPDFTDPEACTEEAITKTAFNPEPMTAQEWALISLEFDTKWAQEEHKNG